MISISLTRARASLRSLSRWARVRPRTNPTASRAASSMWRRRTRSSFRIEHFGLLEDLLPEVTAQVLRRAQVHCASPQECREFTFQARNAQQSRNMARFELHQDIHVALGSEIFPQRGTEHRQPADVMTLGELGNGLFRDRNPDCHDYPSTPANMRAWKMPSSARVPGMSESPFTHMRSAPSV